MITRMVAVALVALGVSACGGPALPEGVAENAADIVTAECDSDGVAKATFKNLTADQIRQRVSAYGEAKEGDAEKLPVSASDGTAQTRCFLAASDIDQVTFVLAK